MALYVQFKDKGIEFAKQAVTEDEAGNTDKALQLYLSSLEYFKTYLKWEKNPKAREAITLKVRCSRWTAGEQPAGEQPARHPAHMRSCTEDS